MLIHNDPAATIIELVWDSSALGHTIVSQLPKGTVLPSQVKYTIAENISTDLDKTHWPGDAFSLGCADEPLPIGIAPADLLVVSQSVSAHEELDAILARFTSLGKPNTAVIFAFEARTAPVLEAKGFRLSFCNQGAAIYKQQPERTNGHDRLNGMNGGAASSREFVIIEPTAPSTAAKSFSNALQKELIKQCQKAVVTSWANFSIQHAEKVEGRTLISLVELETPLLDRLSEPDFDKLKKLITHCERLL
jgi:zearalenone synthase (highly reducing iterative type I polyketide synthase)